MTFLPPFVLVYTQMFFHLCTHDTTTTPFSSFYGFLFLPFLYSLLKLALSFFFSSSTLVTVSLFIVFKKTPSVFPSSTPRNTRSQGVGQAGRVLDRADRRDFVFVT